MVRNLANLSSNTYDVLVIGGGIYGVCIAWDAALRGLSVALVEKGDFGHATSANSLRVIHGGLRYLQHGDIRRVRRSIQERSAFMRIAPYLVHPLPILIPTYGHSLRGKEIFSIAILVNRFLALDQNDQKQFSRGRVVSRRECLRVIPGVYEKGLTGAVVIYDCQMSNSERLVLSFARSAAQAGAELANYVEVTELLIQNGRVSGVRACDVLTADELTIRAKNVVNAGGPWIETVLGALNGRPRRASLSKAFNLLVNRQLISDYAIGVYNQNNFKDRDAILDKGSRLLFIIPWQNRSLIGTAHLPHDVDPDQFQITGAEIQTFIDEINEAYPAANIKFKDIDRVYGGLLPAYDDKTGVQLLRQHRLYDHQKEDHVDGLISVNGVKFTEARYVAQKTVDAVFRKLERKPPKSMTAVTPLYGGQIDRFETFLSEETRRMSRELSEEVVRLLIFQYGSAYANVLTYGKNTNEASQATLDLYSTINAEILHGIREEMAQKLVDIVFRRTTLALPGYLTEESLKMSATVMAQELGWNEERIRKEIAEVRASRFGNTMTSSEAA